MEIDQQRLRADIEKTGQFGKLDAEGWGRTASPCTEANRKAREYLVSKLEEAGLRVMVDPVGTIVGRWIPEGVDPNRSPVAAGSHLDSVQAGGIFDGPLGVYAALESVRAMQDAGLTPDRPIDIVSFTAEEGGTFGQGLLGSSVAIGDMELSDALGLTNDEGETLEAGLERIGFHGNDKIDVSNWHGWIELHVEQSSRLENSNIPVGVVTTISGITRCEVEIEGEANHSGSTSMNERTDALAGGSELVLAIEQVTKELVESESETAVGTVGHLDVDPNAVNVIPGQVELDLDIRDVTQSSIEKIVEHAKSTLARLEAERGVRTDLTRGFDLSPTPMNERLREVAHKAGEKADIETMDLHSGAAHDTMNMAAVTDAVLLFAPSVDGISHSPQEWTEWEDCAKASRVVAETLWEEAQL